MALLLDHTRPNHQTIPKEYTLETKDADLANTFLFTEKDLPGFKSRSHGANSDLPPHLRRRQEQQQQRPEEKKESEGGVKKNKYQPRYRKAIPSSSPCFCFTFSEENRKNITCTDSYQRKPHWLGSFAAKSTVCLCGRKRRSIF